MGALSIFSFYGRSRRTTYGIFFAITIVAYFVLSIPVTLWSIQREPEKFLEGLKPLEKTNPGYLHMFDSILNMPQQYTIAALWMSGVILLILYVIWVALCVRRLHDMKVTGWLVLVPVVIALVPILGYLLVSLVLGLWPGTAGANRYGPDPRLPDAVADVFGREGLAPKAPV